MTSPIWDIKDCGPVLTEQAIVTAVEDRRKALIEGLRSDTFRQLMDADIETVVRRYRDQLRARLDRYYATADLLDAIVDGAFFSIDFSDVILEAMTKEMDEYG